MGEEGFSQVTVTWKNFCHTATYVWVLPPDPLGDDDQIFYNVFLGVASRPVGGQAPWTQPAPTRPQSLEKPYAHSAGIIPVHLGDKITSC